MQVSKVRSMFHERTLRPKTEASLLKDYQRTTLGCGSEFCPLNQLEKALGGHPEFSALKELVKDGMGCRFKKDANKTERLKELQEMMARENHKLAEEESEKATELPANDAARGFSIPMTPEIVDKIRGAMVQPLGLATQHCGLTKNG